MPSSKIPAEWSKKPPELPDLHSFIGEGQTWGERKDRVLFGATFCVEKIWQQLSPNIKQVYVGGSNWCTRTNTAAMASLVTKVVWYNDSYADQPYELARRLWNQTYGYAQCVKKGHIVNVSLRDGPQPITLIPDFVPEFGPYSHFLAQFKSQIGVCDDHKVCSCSTCSTKFEVLLQPKQFWGAKTSECGECLSHQLQYVEAKHQPRDIIHKDKSGRRILYRKAKWGIEPVAVPLGAPPVVVPSDPDLVFGTHVTAHTWQDLINVNNLQGIMSPTSITYSSSVSMENAPPTLSSYSPDEHEPPDQDPYLDEETDQGHAFDEDDN